jgi:hypothetical protein
MKFFNSGEASVKDCEAIQTVKVQIIQTVLSTVLVIYTYNLNHTTSRGFLAQLAVALT